MVALWERLAQLFGNRWEREYGTVADGTIRSWKRMLETYDNADLEGAIKLLESWDSPHPPTFPEFRGLVLAARAKRKPSWTQDRIEAEATRGKGVAGVLEELGKGRLTETAKAELAKMREMLRGN